MKRLIITSAIIIFLCVIQSSSAYDNLRNVLTVKPDLLLLFIVFISFRFGSLEGMLYGFAGGFFHDLISIGPLGLNALIFLNIGFFVGFFRNKIYTESTIAVILLVLASTVFKSLFAFLINAFFSPIDLAANYLKNWLLFGTLTNTVLSPLLFLAYDKLAGLLGGLDER